MVNLLERFVKNDHWVPTSMLMNTLNVDLSLRFKDSCIFNLTTGRKSSARISNLLTVTFYVRPSIHLFVPSFFYSFFLFFSFLFFILSP